MIFMVKVSFSLKLSKKAARKALLTAFIFLCL